MNPELLLLPSASTDTVVVSGTPERKSRSFKRVFVVVTRRRTVAMTVKVILDTVILLWQAVNKFLRRSFRRQSHAAPGAIRGFRVL